jgi:hypothetical protein
MNKRMMYDTWPPEPLTVPTRRETMRELVARERAARDPQTEDVWARAS